jgi:hypothetical protein
LQTLFMNTCFANCLRRCSWTFWQTDNPAIFLKVVLYTVDGNAIILNTLQSTFSATLRHMSFTMSRAATCSARLAASRRHYAACSRSSSLSATITVKGFRPPAKGAGPLSGSVSFGGISWMRQSSGFISAPCLPF